MKKNLLQNLMVNAPVALVEKQTTTIASATVPDDSHIAIEAEEDHQLTRKKIKDLLETSDEAIDRLLQLAVNSEHPRCFEVLSQMLKHTSEMAMDLSALQERRKKLREKKDSSINDGTPGSVTNNTIFVGSTKDLQKFLANENKVIEVEDANTTK